MTQYDLPHNSQDLTGQVALVTGATSGLGWRFARVLAKAGAKVAISGRRQERLDELAEIIRADGGEVAAIRVDMTDADDIKAMVKTAEDQLGLITILVNNAGIPDAQRAHKMEVDLIDRVIGTNLRGPFILSVEVAKRLIAEKVPGRIINLASAAAFHYTGEGAALYSVTKSAIVRMTETLAVEWGRNMINVNALSPGVFDSEMTAGMIDRIGDISGNMPRKRLGAQALLDSSLLFLASPASEAVTGTVIRADDAQYPR